MTETDQFLPRDGHKVQQSTPMRHRKDGGNKMLYKLVVVVVTKLRIYAKSPQQQL